MILHALRFVRGAVSTKDIVPEMKHFAIQHGTVRGFNGTLALSSPVDLDIACAPKAVPLVQAITNCDDVVSLNMTDSGRLRVSSGSFRANIECVDMANLPHQAPSGQPIEFDGKRMLEAIDKLVPFVGNDASRPWTNGILLRGSSAFATNNVCLVEYWLGPPMPITVNIPMAAIQELSRVGEPPTHAQVDENSITFHYANGRWIRTALYSTEWPDLSRILDRANAAQAVPEELFVGLDAIKPFLDPTGRVHFRNGAVHTSESDEQGASYKVPELHHAGIYNLKMLSLLRGVAATADFSQYPDPVVFYGENLRGAIVGQRS